MKPAKDKAPSELVAQVRAVARPTPPKEEPTPMDKAVKVLLSDVIRTHGCLSRTRVPKLAATLGLDADELNLRLYQALDDLLGSAAADAVPPPIAKRVVVDTLEYRSNHGAAPRGTGTWWFMFGDMPIRFAGRYSDAARDAAKMAREVGLEVIRLRS